MPETLFHKDAGLRPATLLKETLAQVFPVNFAKFPRTPSPTEQLRWLFLFLTVKCVQAVRLATLLKRDPSTGFSEPAIRRSSTK